MTSREYRYLKGVKFMNFFGKTISVPAKHYFMRHRVSGYTDAQYLKWKQQQCVQQNLNEGVTDWETPGYTNTILPLVVEDHTGNGNAPSAYDLKYLIKFNPFFNDQGEIVERSVATDDQPE